MFVVKLYSRKIFSYVFFVRKYFHNEIKANYGTSKEVYTDTSVMVVYTPYLNGVALQGSVIIPV